MKKNQFPEMTPAFDQRVRQTLQNLPEQPRQQVRRNPFKLMITVGIAAALCIGGTAFAASGIPEARKLIPFCLTAVQKRA